jgi:hypothetical protein
MFVVGVSVTVHPEVIQTGSWRSVSGSSIKEEVKKKISPGAGSFLASQPM